MTRWAQLGEIDCSSLHGTLKVDPYEDVDAHELKRLRKEVRMSRETIKNLKLTIKLLNMSLEHAQRAIDELLRDWQALTGCARRAQPTSRLSTSRLHGDLK